MKTILLPVMIFILYFPMLSCAASFDCAKASSATEKLICGDEKISALDEQLATSYKAALEKATDKDAFKKMQVEWLKQQRACKEAGCLAQSYQARIAELNTTLNAVAQSSIDASSTTTPKPKRDFKKPLSFKLVFGDSYPICQPYVNMLNEAKYEINPVCERKILPEFPQFKETQWAEITDKQETEKIMEENYRMEYAYLNILDPSQYKNPLDSVKKEIKENYSKLFFTKFDVDMDGKLEIIYKYVSLYGGKNGLGEDNNTCNSHNYFYIKNEKITIEKASKELFFKSPSAFMNLGSHNDLFYFKNEKIFNSHWAGKKVTWTSGYDIDLYTTQNSLICGINIIQ